VVIWNIFPVLVCCTKKNLAALIDGAINSKQNAPCFLVARNAKKLLFKIYLTYQGTLANRVTRLGEFLPIVSLNSFIEMT
jgi:hypothetical protein